MADHLHRRLSDLGTRLWRSDRGMAAVLAVLAVAALAGAALAVAGKLGPGRYGTYHCAGAERTSWYDFAHAIFIGQEALTGRKGPKLRPIATKDYPTAARRPEDSTLDSSLYQATFGEGPIDWRAGLTDVLRDLLVPQGEEKT
mgnify:CR=1 FL=1